MVSVQSLAYHPTHSNTKDNNQTIMFKLVAFLAVVAVAAARPGYFGHHYETPIIYEAAPIVHHEPIITKVGAIYESVPAAVSHQSQTVIHHSKPIVTPIYATAIKTYHTPIVKSISSPLIYGFDSHYNHHY